MLYSDDFGKTWLFLGGCDESPVPGGDEPKAEELPDGSILLSSRCTGGRNFNIFTFSDTRSGQGTWGQVAFSGSGNKGVTALSNACNGEVLLVPVTRKKDKKTMFLLLQSLPFGSGRANVGIYYKALESLADYRTPDAIAKDWDGRHQSSYISSAYSTMTWQKNNTIGFVYEEDTYGTSGGGYTIIYKNYSIEQITDSAFTYNPSVNGDSLTALDMGAVVDDVTSTDNVGTIVGQYTPEAARLVNDAYSEYAAHPSRQQYERLNGIIGSAPRVKMGLERYYTLRNYGRGAKRYALYANNATELSVSTNRKAEKAMWCIVPTADDPEVFYLVNKAHPKSMVGPTLAVEKRTVLTSNPKEAGRYRIVSTTQGLSKLQCLNPTNATYPFLHLAGDNVRIVPWLASSPANNAPSFWYIEPTDVMTGIEHITLPLNPNAAEAAEACYDLGGRAIQQPQKGQVYIKGGKKHVE
ncbi:sialidase family protein [Hallella sp.]|uniref:sialidase family protein n=1 Tax=Hallella sp. TaxID=2980186 RepID=UPI00307EE6CF